MKFDRNRFRLCVKREQFEDSNVETIVLFAPVNRQEKNLCACVSCWLRQIDKNGQIQSCIEGHLGLSFSAVLNRVMAFLRSASRYNSLVLRKFSSISSTHHAKNDFHAQFVRPEWFACHRQFSDSRNPCVSTTNQQRSGDGNGTSMIASMSTAATATSPKAAAAAAAAASRNPNTPPPRDPLDVSFNDPIAAFKSKTTWELVRALFVYIVCSSEYLVENNMKVKAERRQRTTTMRGREQQCRWKYTYECVACACLRVWV